MGLKSQEPETTTESETKSEMPEQLHHPGTWGITQSVSGQTFVSESEEEKEFNGFLIYKPRLKLFSF